MLFSLLWVASLDSSVHYRHSRIDSSSLGQRPQFSPFCISMHTFRHSVPGEMSAVHTWVHHSTTEQRGLKRISEDHQVPALMGKGSLDGITQLAVQACPENPQGWGLTTSLRRLCQWLLSLQSISWSASS